jgi:tetratricopeptide (TPR) repeat protein
MKIVTLPSDREQDPLKNIIFISLPDGTEREIEGFTINNKHLIPIEVPEGQSEWDMKDLSWEMIVSAMLKIFAYNPKHEEISYYRNFIFAVQPNLVSELTKTGIIKAESKNFDLAEEIFLSLNHLEPESPATYLNLALVYEEQAALFEKTGSPLEEEYIEKAFSVYSEGLQQHPNSADLHFYAGYFFLKNRNLAKTLEHFDTFLTIAPNDERNPQVKEVIDKIGIQDTDDQLFAEAFDLIKLGNESEAIIRIDEFLLRNPTVWNAWFLKGWASRRISNYKNGKLALEKCLIYEKNNVDVYNELAICCMEIEKFKEAETYLKRALQLEPENIKIISNFGVMNIKIGNPNEALRFFQTALEFNPEDKVAAQYIKLISEEA